MKRPKVIFFDAVGTLFGVRGSVGEVYSAIAHQHGVEAPAEALNHAFFQNFKSASPMAFPGVAPDDIPEREFSWWWAIAAQTFQQVGVLDQFDNFAGFFANLYAHFATAEPWYLYPDTLSTLEHWRSQGVELGVLSNFDSRLHKVLPAMGLADYFSSVTISTEVGAAKPSAAVFQVALQKHGALPSQAWHVGDSFKQDYQGAKDVGMRGIWLRRRDSSL
jgi:putative hydrolase of the HAD superfamily